MRFLIFFLLLLGCTPECMVISDACEIQFWQTGVETSFNLEEEGFTDEGYCFHQKFLCTGQRRFQGVDADGIERDYWLLGFNEDGEEIFNAPFVAEQDEQDYFEDYPFEDWSNEDSGTNPWTEGVNPTITKTVGGSSDRLSINVSGFVAGTYPIQYDFTRSGGGSLSLSFLNIVFYKAGVNVGSEGILLTGGGPNYTGTENVTLTDIPDKCSVYITHPALAGNTTMTITLNENFISIAGFGPVKYSLDMTPSDEAMCDSKVQFKIYTGTEVLTGDDEGELDITHEDSEELFYSDYVEFVSTWVNSPGSGRVDIQYRSIQNFAGLLYDSDSPYFQIQLEGRFRKERKQTQQKEIELTEMILNTAASVKKQRKLSIDDVPDYMHTKINLILAHAASGSVLVNGKEISIGETYEEGERPESYPMTPADVWLTIKNYYKNNVI